MGTSDFTIIIGDRVKQRRIELSMTQEELSQKVGLAGKSSISKIEKGSSTIPTDKLPLFAKALKTSVPYLVGVDLRSRWVTSFREAYYEIMSEAEKEDLIAANIDQSSWDKVIDEDIITLDFACNVADTLGCSLDEMTGLREEAALKFLTKEEINIILCYRRADYRDKNTVINVLDRYSEDANIPLASESSSEKAI